MSPMVISFCWTLLHSLWQGVLAAVVAAAIRLFTKNSLPVRRYNLLSLLLLCFCTTAVITWFYEWTTLSVDSGSKVLSGIFDGQPGFSGWISAHANGIVMIWLIVLLAKTAKMVFTLSYTGYIRQRKSAEATAYWRNKVDRLCKQLNIQKPVVLMESGIVRTPMVFGHLKPVIFVPLGMLTHLPAEQVEAILLHELAHIRRSDYLVNLLQAVAGIVFFYNPAVLWLSALVREEREHCCDDIAIEQTGNRKQYVETLICFQEYMLYRCTFRKAVFPGFKTRLSERVRRIVNRQNPTLNIAEKCSLLGSCLIAVLFLSVIAGPGKKQISTTHPPAVSRFPVSTEFPIGQVVENIGNDLLKKGIIRDKNDLFFELTNTQLLVNGHRQSEICRRNFFAKYIGASHYPIPPELRNEPGFGIFFNAVTRVYGVGTRPPAWDASNQHFQI